MPVGDLNFGKYININEMVVTNYEYGLCFNDEITAPVPMLSTSNVICGFISTGSKLTDNSLSQQKDNEVKR